MAVSTPATTGVPPPGATAGTRLESHGRGPFGTFVAALAGQPVTEIAVEIRDHDAANAALPLFHGAQHTLRQRPRGGLNGARFAPRGPITCLSGP
ncbi:MAG: hypothetical protein ACSLE9_17695 [Burkholderiaceae bacterium]